MRAPIDRPITGTMIVYKRYRLSRVKHPAPFNKTLRGAKRRAERRLRSKQKETPDVIDVLGLPFEPAKPLHSRKRYWETP